jgi:hypothetical protein
MEKGNNSKHNLLLRKVSEKKEQQELQYFHQFEIFLSKRKTNHPMKMRKTNRTMRSIHVSQH